jgi:uncharacterized protein YggE
MCGIGVAVAALALAPAGAMAQQTTGSPATTLTASGTASIKPTPKDPHSDASIREAVKAASAKALPLAVADARTEASALAAAAGVQLGGLLSISDVPAPGYPFLFSPQNGTFGNGHFCGRQRNFKTVITKNGARRRVLLKGTHTVCRVPPSVQESVSLTYAVTG